MINMHVFCSKASKLVDFGYDCYPTSKLKEYLKRLNYRLQTLNMISFAQKLD